MRKKIECVVAITALEQRTLPHSAEPTLADGESVTPPTPPPNHQDVARLGRQTVADIVALDQALPERRLGRGSEDILPAPLPAQPQAVLDQGVSQASTLKASAPCMNSTSQLNASNYPPPGMMLFPISQIQQVLDIYDRRKQRIQDLEAQLDIVEQNRNQKRTLFADHDELQPTNDPAGPDQENPLAAALGWGLVHHAKITNIDQLYSLLKDLGVDRKHFRALYHNEEFRRSFPPSPGTDNAKPRSRNLPGEQAKQSPFEGALGAVKRAPSARNAVMIAHNSTAQFPPAPAESRASE